MSGKLHGYARVPVASDADANNLENQHRVLADCEQVFEDVGSGISWNRPDRALLQSEAFAGYRQRRVVVEHRLALPVQLGIHQARYFGRIKTRFQLYLPPRWTP